MHATELKTGTVAGIKQQLGLKGTGKAARILGLEIRLSVV
jgi:hypothetical protein